MKLKFLGAAREVTGSKVLVTADSGKRILLDCGMFQGKGLETDGMNRDLGFDPSLIDHILLTHAHIDHSGLIPYAYKMGFRGSIVCSNATRDLCSIMLADPDSLNATGIHTLMVRGLGYGVCGRKINSLDFLIPHPSSFHLTYFFNSSLTFFQSGYTSDNSL